MTALDGAFLKVNNTFCGWINFSKDELIGVKRIQDLFTMGAKIFHQTHWVPTLQMQGSLAEIKMDIRRKDGQIIPVLMNARRRRRAEGEFDEIAVFMAEDRNRYERELMAARRRADALLDMERDSQTLLRDRALFAEQMVGIVSHDLRNPLSTILMAAKLLERADGERRVRVLGHVRDAAERAKRLVEDLLDFTQSRVGSGLSVNLNLINLHDLVERTAEELKLSFPGRQFELRITGSGNCVADEDRLVQLLDNLVSNASVYGSEETPITISATTEGATAMLQVHNGGLPIPADKISGIFEPLVRGHTGTTTRSVGLGLFIVNQIAKAHQGTMEVTSTVEAGTTFTFRFPKEGIA